MTFPVTMQCSVDVVLEASIFFLLYVFPLKKSDDDLDVCSSVIGFLVHRGMVKVSESEAI